MKEDSLLCPCGTNIKYADCCEPYHENTKSPATPELLMRSRYSAYVLQNEAYLLNTWHSKTRPKALNFEDNPVVWLSLEILSSQEGDDKDRSGTVDFLTNYLENGQLCILQENSQFTKEDDQWMYLKGDCSMTKEKLQRNQPCPCGSEKKFKKCCLNR